MGGGGAPSPRLPHLPMRLRPALRLHCHTYIIPPNPDKAVETNVSVTLPHVD